MAFEGHVFSPSLEGIVSAGVSFLSSTPLLGLPPTHSFIGGGVYAIYYHPDANSCFPAYADLPVDTPIYVGKAVQPGSRKGKETLTTDPALYKRLREHAGSIRKTPTLILEHFSVRFAILLDDAADFIRPLESGMIRAHSPIWNQVVDGFGNHTPGKGRFGQARSLWDVLHPGREWAAKCLGTPKMTAEEVTRAVKSHLSGQ